MTYSEKLKDPRWQKKRLKILERDEFACTMCGDDTTELHVHHKKYNGEPWEAIDSELITVCKSCHQGIEFINEDYKHTGIIRSNKVTYRNGVINILFQHPDGYYFFTNNNENKSCISTKHEELLLHLEYFEKYN